MRLRSFFVIVLTAATLATYAAAQGVLPCGEVRAVDYTLTFEVLPESSTPTDFVLMRFPVGGQGESLELDATLQADGKYVAKVGGFLNNLDYTISVFARNDQGDSEASNSLTVPATVRGACPSGPPLPPRLLEIVERLEAVVRDLRGAIAQ